MVVTMVVMMMALQTTEGRCFPLQGPGRAKGGDDWKDEQRKEG